MIVGTEGLSVASSAQADWTSSQRSSVSPSLVVLGGRTGRSPDKTPLMTPQLRWYDWNGTRPVNTCERMYG